MPDQPGTSIHETAAIHELAHQARQVRLCMRTMDWMKMPFVLMLAYALLFCQIDDRPASTGWMLSVLFSTLLTSLMFVWMYVEQRRTLKAWRKLRHILASRQEEIRGNIRFSEIGNLLEVTVTGARKGSFVDVPAALLGSLLRSLRAEDEVVLTQDQRELLHELVIPRKTIRNGGQIVDIARNEVRTAATIALALLGNRSSLPVLERFARKTDDPALRKAALQSADQIRERMPYDPKQMLRAASAPERTDMLLRAVAADKSTDNSSQQLLRANLSGNPSERE